jgi:hypothetical protein
MNRHQFLGYLQNLEHLPTAASEAAQAVVEEYPFFHAAHLLLAVAYEQQQDVRASQALRKAAAFLPSRVLLYGHIHAQGGQEEKSRKVITPSPLGSEVGFTKSEIQAIPNPFDDGGHQVVDHKNQELSHVSGPQKGVEFEVAALLHSGETVGFDEGLDSADLGGLKQQVAVELISAPAIESHSLLETSLEVEAKDEAAKKGDAQDWLKTAENVSATDPLDELDKEWISKGVETGVALGVSEIALAEGSQSSESQSAKTFLDWLKAPKPADVGGGKEDQKKKAKSALIDRFIVQEPRISKPKAEFFTPQQAAKQSLVNDPNVASETLGGIYELQGNFGQAVKIYEALALKFPGKSLYFASLAKRAREKQQQNRSK